jgi:lipopolysaccharide heptosyltransferase I
MSDARFLLVRLGSLGDIVHALPATSALRDRFPDARIDWLVEARWRRLLEGNPDLNEVITLDRGSLATIGKTAVALRAKKYTCAIDFQGLYKSSLAAFASRAPKRIGFRSSYAREGLASMFYTDTFNPVGAHKVDHNLTLARGAGAVDAPARFPVAITSDDEATTERELAKHNLREFFVLNPGGGWQSKCWPAERYGSLSDKLQQRYGWRSVVTYGPGEDDLAKAVLDASVGEKPAALPLALGPLMALLRCAKLMISADTGPLHLAAAIGTPVVGLYGPTDPARNGPYGQIDAVIRNARVSETTYRRGVSYSPSMISITVEQVLQAVDRRLRRGS